MKTPVALCSLLVVTILAACNFDKLDEPTISDICETLQPVYEGEIEALLEQSCTYSNCHEGGASFGDYTTYQSMIPNLESGIFMERVLNIRDMPPPYAPDGKPKELDASELELIECWLANEFPEN